MEFRSKSYVAAGDNEPRAIAGEVEAAGSTAETATANPSAAAFYVLGPFPYSGRLKTSLLHRRPYVPPPLPPKDPTH